MADLILVLNSGSSSIKFAVFTRTDSALDLSVRGQIEGITTAPRFIAKTGDGAVIHEKSWGEGFQLGHEGAIEYLRRFLGEQSGGRKLLAVGHRVVHGGLKHFEPVRVEKKVFAELEEAIPLAPLHQPQSLALIKLIMEQLPALPQVACFDTGFHRTNPLLAQMFALPQAMTDAGIRRYGLHGLSYEYIASVLRERDPRAAGGKTIVLHLGNGSSLCAMEAGKSITSTMGFSALDGVPMGTRCGALDPGVILYLMEYRGMDAAAIKKLLYYESGLLGVSGISSDVRELLESSAPPAKLALDLFCYRIGREIGSLAAALSGLDAMVFTAGVGENGVRIREQVCRHASWLGVELDSTANTKPGESGLITTERSKVEVRVIPTNEELMVAWHTMKALGL